MSLPARSQGPMYFACKAQQEYDRKKDIEREEDRRSEKSNAQRFLDALENSNRIAAIQSPIPSTINLTLNVSVSSDAEVQNVKDTLQDFVNSLKLND